MSLFSLNIVKIRLFLSNFTSLVDKKSISTYMYNHIYEKTYVIFMETLSFFKAMADDTRLKVLMLLSLKGELCVCDLQNALEISQPKVSRHLAELRRNELLVDERRAKWVYYKLNPAMPAWMNDIISTSSQNSHQYLEDCLSRLNSDCSNC